MIQVFILALALQESPFKATLQVERQRGDATSVVAGTLIVRPGEALLLELGPDRFLVRDGRAIEHRRGRKTARGWDVRRTDHFHPADAWRVGREGLDRWFEVTEAGLHRELPDRGFAPVKIPLGPSARVVAQGRDRREGTRVLSLIPRSATLREKFIALDACVDAEGRIVQLTARSPAETVIWTATSFEELETLEDCLFEVNFGTVTVEEP